MIFENEDNVKLTISKGEWVHNFTDFKEFLNFYYSNIVNSDSVSWTDFVYNNYLEKSKREINGYTMEGANELLQYEIDNFYKKNNFEVHRKSDGFNIGCIIKNKNVNEFVKTPSTGVTGRYNWLNELFIYKFLEKTEYGPKVHFDIPDFAPIVLIRAEDIKKEKDEYINFPEKVHKSIGKDQDLSTSDLAEVGAADILVGRILLLDDLHFKEGTNYSFFRDGNGKVKLKIFDLMSQHYNEKDLKPIYPEFGHSIEKNVFYTKRHPFYAVSGSFIHEDFRNLAIDLGIEHIEKNKEKFQNAIKEAEKETYEVLEKIKQKYPEKEDQKIISELYNEKAFLEFRRTVSDNLANIENFHSKSVVIKPSAALIGRNFQDKKDENDKRSMAVVYRGKNDPKKVTEQSLKFKEYLKNKESKESGVN